MQGFSRLSAASVLEILQSSKVHEGQSEANLRLRLETIGACTQLTAMTPSTTTHARYQGFCKAGHSPFGVNLLRKMITGADDAQHVSLQAQKAHLEREPQSCPQVKRKTGLLSKPAYQLCLTVASSAKATNQISAKSQRCQESKSILKSAVCTASILSWILCDT